MSVDLSSQQSAIATDFFGITHVVWYDHRHYRPDHQSHHRRPCRCLDYPLKIPDRAGMFLMPARQGQSSRLNPPSLYLPVNLLPHYLATQHGQTIQQDLMGWSVIGL